MFDRWVVVSENMILYFPYSRREDADAFARSRRSNGYLAYVISEGAYIANRLLRNRSY